MKRFTENECLNILRQARWGDKVRCVYCNSEKIAKYGKDRKGFPRYMCKDCNKGFNDRTNTVFDGSQIPIEEWFEIIHDYRKKSLRKMSIDLLRPYNTVHACAKKIKEDALVSTIRDITRNHNDKNSIIKKRYEHVDESSIIRPQFVVHEERVQRKPMARRPKVLMLGWEFYPKMAGGLGKVCYELAKALKDRVDLTIILPIHVEHEGMEIISTNLGAMQIRTILSPYMTEENYRLMLGRSEKELYGADMFEEVERFALRCKELAKGRDFDIIHAHDWMTFRAGILIKEMTGKPLVLHVHTTEIDKGCGLGVNQKVFTLEKEAFEKADMIFAVSGYTKSTVVKHYGIDPSKVKVIYNALDSGIYESLQSQKHEKEKKIVLYFGRVTMHKGPDYFIHAAQKVLTKQKNVLFVIAGTGDMLTRMIELSCNLGISNNVLFTGYLSESEAKEIYKIADIYIMPSVREPFGVTALEAMATGVPTIISNNSGVSEVVHNCFKVDFWDTDEMANKIVSCLRYGSLSKTISENCANDVRKLDWAKQADLCVDFYSNLIK